MTRLLRGLERAVRILAPMAAATLLIAVAVASGDHAHVVMGGLR